MRKSVLDEMQLQMRNRIGNQAFMILFYLLLTDVGLNGFGVKWLQYPLNVFVIMVSTMFYYLIRILWAGAYIGPDSSIKKAARKTAATVITAAVAASVSIFAIWKNNTETQVPDRTSAMVLFIFSAVAIVVAVIVSIASMKQNRGKDQ